MCLKTQDLEIVIDLYYFPIIGLGVILGVKWLEELGKVVSNYRKIIMVFIMGASK